MIYIWSDSAEREPKQSLHEVWVNNVHLEQKFSSSCLCVKTPQNQVEGKIWSFEDTLN